MASKRRPLLLGSVVLLVLLLVGCSLLLRHEGGEPLTGRYIRLNVSPAAAARAITVSEYEVTGLQIELWGPDEELLGTIEWEVLDGPRSYLVPVEQTGQHQIVVRHFGELDGEEVEAQESASFTIGAMIITVIDVVPGCIGVIRVAGGADDGQEDPNAWLYGFWVEAGTAAPHTMTLEIRADGALVMWNNYLAVNDDIEWEGTWSLEGDTLSGTTPFGAFSGELTRLGEHAFQLSLPDGMVFWRRGTQPGGWVFDQTPIPVSTEVLVQGALAEGQMNLYVLTAPATGTYEVQFWGADSWPDPDGYSHTMEYSTPHVYADDQQTELSAHWDSEAPVAKTVDLAEGQVVYVIIGAEGEGGTYSFGVFWYP